MRKNTVEAFKAWTNGKNHRKCPAIWTTGGILFSYSTEIGRFSQATDRRVLLNMERYSVTTTVQQRGIMQLLEDAGVQVVACTDADDYRRQELTF